MFGVTAIRRNRHLVKNYTVENYLNILTWPLLDVSAEQKLLP